MSISWNSKTPHVTVDMHFGIQPVNFSIQSHKQSQKFTQNATTFPGMVQWKN